MGERAVPIEDWWPRLSIAGKHAILADLAAPLDDGVRSEIVELIGRSAPERLSEREVDFIRTQTEFVD
ncbi:hypothetical protein [Agromyces binzhouensis]|uniref:hypothetical protein n=1 Tax=Agromyces binzhouensis TaxID=1817495 RepID=UPI003645DFBC